MFSFLINQLEHNIMSPVFFTCAMDVLFGSVIINLKKSMRKMLANGQLWALFFIAIFMLVWLYVLVALNMAMVSYLYEIVLENVETDLIEVLNK